MDLQHGWRRVIKSLKMWGQNPLCEQVGALHDSPAGLACQSLQCTQLFFILKALFNNVSTLKIWAAWPYMLSVSLIRCKNEALKNLKKKNCTSKALLSTPKEWNKQVTRFFILIFPVDCCVRIKGKPDCLFSHIFLDSDSNCFNFKAFAFLAV